MLFQHHLFSFLSLLSALIFSTNAARQLHHELDSTYGRRIAGKHRHRSRPEDLASQRIKLAQVDLRHPKPHTRAKRGPSATLTTSDPAAATVSSSVLLYSGRQPAPGQCQNSYTSDGCVEPYYTPDALGMTLAAGRSFAANGHVNFKYIAMADYRGEGTYRNIPSYWTILSGGTHFDPYNNQPGTPYIGKSYYPWSQGANLPVLGYCIVWIVSVVSYKRDGVKCEG